MSWKFWKKSDKIPEKPEPVGFTSESLRALDILLRHLEENISRDALVEAEKIGRDVDVAMITQHFFKYIKTNKKDKFI